MRTIVGILVAIGFVATVVYVTLQQNQVTCEVCMSYRGRQKCEEASAVDAAAAVMQATTSACSQISSGVTDGIQCNGSRPVSSRCSE